MVPGDMKSVCAAKQKQKLHLVEQHNCHQAAVAAFMLFLFIHIDAALKVN